MANPTYKLIASQVVGSGGASSITFSSIPQTFTDLKLVMSGRNNSVVGTYMTFNGSSSGYSERLLYGTGSAANSTNTSGSYINWSFLSNVSSDTANTFSNSEFYIPNYTGSNYKSVSSDSVTENNATAANIYVNAALWSNTAAITSITLTCNTAQFVQYSTFYLYGIKNS
jgi:hypothetical protein